VKANRLVLLAVAGTSVLALTGCAPSGNIAAKVGGAKVTTSEVDFLTRMQCNALDRASKNPAQQGSSQMVPIAQVRTGMVNTLVQNELNRQLAARDHLGYDKATLRSVMAQFESVVSAAPAKDRDRFRDLVEDVYRGQLEVYTLAQGQLRAQGVTNPSQQQVDQAVAAIQDDFRKHVGIEVNPQYGADDSGTAGSVDPSLSLAVSSFAKKSQSAQPDAVFVSKLPADQRCG
jgi:hypothetical protein